MAEETEIDEVLRNAFQKAAEPADNSGVADAIRARAEAGETGLLINSSHAPGFTNWPSWVPFVGAVVVLGALGTGLGVAGVFGRSVNEVQVIGREGILQTSAILKACPGGPSIGAVPAGTRALIMQRSEDGKFLGIRNPQDFSEIAWMPKSDLVIDSGQLDVASLPVGESCPVVTVSLLPTATPTPVPEPTKSQPPAPQKPSDTSAPVINSVTANPTTIAVTDPTTITVSASDNVGVTGVTITWSDQYSGSASMTKSGSNWTYTFTPPTNASGNITFTVQAVDAAGNKSNSASVVVKHYYLG